MASGSHERFSDDPPSRECGVRQTFLHPAFRASPGSRKQWEANKARSRAAGLISAQVGIYGSSTVCERFHLNRIRPNSGDNNAESKPSLQFLVVLSVRLPELRFRVRHFPYR